VSGASAHNAATATTIEEAIAFYDSPAFNNSPAGRAGAIDLTAEQIDDIGRFLRSVNAAFNAQLALKRLEAARAVLLAFPFSHLDVQRELLRLANVEVIDALEDLLGQPGLDVESRIALATARVLIDGARVEPSPILRLVTLHAPWQ
jgi:hypothetical protein